MRPVFLALLLAAAVAAGPARAQGFNMAQGGDSEIQVYADEGIEWVSEAARVVARGNATAVRGKVTVVADSLTAYYRDGPGGNEIWRLDADGNVTIRTPTETATGHKGTYDLDKAIFVLRGAPARLVTAKETVTAKDTLEYWEKERMAVARGDAVATNNEKTIKSDVLTAHFKENAKGALEMRRADAYGHVVLITPKDNVTGDRGDYNVETGIATVAGSVKLIRDGNELNGGYAHVNLNTGISKLFGAAPGQKNGDARAHGTFVPEKKGNSPDEKDGDTRRAVFQGAAPKSGTDADNDAGQR
jgi:Uncharacterized protein conserved in bacteria